MINIIYFYNTFSIDKTKYLLILFKTVTYVFVIQIQITVIYSSCDLYNNTLYIWLETSGGNINCKR